MTPTGCSMGNIEPEKILKLDINGNLFGDPATKESFLHLAMYEKRPQVQPLFTCIQHIPSR